MRYSLRGNPDISSKSGKIGPRRVGCGLLHCGLYSLLRNLSHRGRTGTIANRALTWKPGRRHPNGRVEGKSKGFPASGGTDPAKQGEAGSVS
jgi:hypothetical protein